MSQPDFIQKSGDEESVSTFIDIAAGLFLAAVAIGALAWLVPYHTKALSAENDIAPGFFPSVTAWIVLGLSIGLVAVTAFRQRVAASGLSGYAIIVEIVVWGSIAGLIMLGLSTIGFLFTAPLLISTSMVFAGYRKWWTVALVSVLCPLIIDQAIWFVFTVDLP